MRSALIGNSGLVGGSLNRGFTEQFTSKNIQQLSGQYDIVVVAAPSAVKWQANKNPKEDLDQIKKLVNVVNTCEIKTLVHFSTIDVYSQHQLTNGADEAVQPLADCHYGANRFFAENAWKAKQVKIIRLPGLFGTNLKKNIIFDLMNGKNPKINLDSKYQWLNLSELDSILEFCLSTDGDTLNIAPEPISNKELLTCFDDPVFIKTEENIQHYSMTSRLYQQKCKQRILQEIKGYVNA